MNAISVRAQGSGFGVQNLARERFRPAASPEVLNPEPRTLNPFGCGCAAIWWIGLLTVLTAGCASWTSSIPKTENISQKRQARTEAAVRRFGEQRNRAEIEAARCRWQQGDVDGSTETLMRVLDRSPDDVEARLLLAESLVAAVRACEGISYLEPAMASRPNDARLH
ncbi:MAG: tetratricopeptide repeat protein, partial [Planctomycetota bacterium]